MTEILTESFCERCGTRYTFESVAPRQRRLGRIRVLGRGFKNFVMSDDSSLDEAMAAARSDAERDATTQQLDAFHRTFNFCMSCRQYTCGNCWNAVEARCLSCAPLALAEVPDTAFGGLDAARMLRVMGPPADARTVDRPELIGVEEAVAAHQHAEAPVVEMAEPGLEITALERDEAIVAPAPEPDFAFASDLLPAGDTGIEVAPVEAEVAPVAVEAEIAPAAEIAPVAVEAAEPPEVASTGLLGLEPGASLDDAIAAYEASLADEPAAGGPGVDVVEQPTWAAVAAATAPEPGPEPAPVAAAAPPEAPPAAQPDVAAPPPAAVTPPEQAAPVPPAPTAPLGTPPSVPQWPTGPRWPTAIPARQSAPADASAADPLTTIMARHATEAMWAASSRDVVQPPVAAPAQPAAGVQPCVSCGISLSATARFCRRCGTSQVG